MTSRHRPTNPSPALYSGHLSYEQGLVESHASSGWPGSLGSLESGGSEKVDPLSMEDRVGESPNTSASAISALALPRSHSYELKTQSRSLETHPTERCGNIREQRYVTMLNLLKGKDSTADTTSSYNPTKLISGTNPVSALLRKDLKHKIVTNSCSFRTPDPPVGASRYPIHRGTGLHSCDWEQHYRILGVTEPRIQYLRAVGCFELPPSSRCADLLEIYFTYVYPMLPVIDREDFLAHYYGPGEPPPLILLHAVFLAASRYANCGGGSSDDVSEIRNHCDQLHSKLRALMEADISADRVAMIQASLIASLHWEGREGLNSAIDNLSLSVRACQEMGFHRKMTSEPQRGSDKMTSQQSLHRRIWWFVYALDRFNATQEGTPFLINEMDCDAEILTEEDLIGEDTLTCRVALFSLSLARLIEDAVRWLYAPGEDHTTLFSSRGVLCRQRLDFQLEQLASQITDTLIPCGDLSTALETTTSKVSVLCGALLLTHLDAVRILIHRPFILYPDPHGFGVYGSRDACRTYAVNIVSRLHSLLSHGLLRFSWPFTVYAVVNCLLIFWYDVSSPPSVDPMTTSKARRDYTAVVNLLRIMGKTWWAAAAKHELAQALAHAADELQVRGRQTIEEGAPQGDLASGNMHQNDGQLEYNYGNPPTPLSGSAIQNYMGTGEQSNGDLFSGCGSSDYWASIGLDFDMDVAGNIFSILQTGYPV